MTYVHVKVSLFVISLVLLVKYRAYRPIELLLSNVVQISNHSNGVRKSDDTRSLIFIKTHKTGSSTVTALILRKCIKSRLNCFIPKRKAPGMTYMFEKPKDYREVVNGMTLSMCD